LREGVIVSHLDFKVLDKQVGQYAVDPKSHKGYKYSEDRYVAKVLKELFFLHVKARVVDYWRQVKVKK
jgi:hypothetical protein